MQHFIGHPLLLSSECVDISARRKPDNHTLLLRSRDEIFLIQACVLNVFHVLRKGDPLPDIETQKRQYGIGVRHILFDNQKYDLPEDFWRGLRQYSTYNSWGVVGIAALYIGVNSFYAGFKWQDDNLGLCRFSYREYVMDKREYNTLKSTITGEVKFQKIPGGIIRKNKRGIALHLESMTLEISDNPTLYEGV